MPPYAKSGSGPDGGYAGPRLAGLLLAHGANLLVAAHAQPTLRPLDLALMFHGPWLKARQWAPLLGILAGNRST
eukprot:1233736-Rhodomonas_salina.5